MGDTKERLLLAYVKCALDVPALNAVSRAYSSCGRVRAPGYGSCPTALTSKGPPAVTEPP